MRTIGSRSCDGKSDDLMPINSTSDRYYRYQDDCGAAFTERHPENYYLSDSAARNLEMLAEDYHFEYPDEPFVWLNDASLPWGGKFDLAGTWSGSHSEHGCGISVDVRGNGSVSEGNIPAARRARFLEAARRNHVQVLPEPTQQHPSAPPHFHLRLIQEKDATPCPT